MPLGSWTNELKDVAWAQGCRMPERLTEDSCPVSSGIGMHVDRYRATADKCHACDGTGKVPQ